MLPWGHDYKKHRHRFIKDRIPIRYAVKFDSAFDSDCIYSENIAGLRPDIKSKITFKLAPYDAFYVNQDNLYYEDELLTVPFDILKWINKYFGNADYSGTITFCTSNWDKLNKKWVFVLGLSTTLSQAERNRLYLIFNQDKPFYGNVLFKVGEHRVFKFYLPSSALIH